MERSDVYDVAPVDFLPTVEVAACYIEIDSKLLLLQRGKVNFEPGLWGVPAGKLEKGESPDAAARRELFEETGIKIDHDSQIKFFGSLYIRKPFVDFIYHLFRIEFKQMPSVVLSKEHSDFKWVASHERQDLPLMSGAEEALQRYRCLTSH
ncbi:MAG: NUDIX hydrolase [Parachlamydiaceae bacterium]|nr:NUDIX hydrolase [Parachlamydiaceae bacterium]